jgi:hypothetical protein
MTASSFEPSRMYNYVRSRQLENTYPGDSKTGNWVSTSFRIAKGWGNVEESMWPYETSNWPPVEPEGLDAFAKENRILAYQRVKTVLECKMLLKNNNPVVIAVGIDDSWHAPKYGVISSPTKKIDDKTHSICVIDFDDEKHLFTFLNSWGTSWGNSGLGYLPYSYFANRFIEGWFIVALDHDRLIPIQGKGIRLYSWGISSPLGNTLHGIEFIDNEKNEIIGWAFCVEEDDRLCIEEIFVRPKWRGRGYGRNLGIELKNLSNEKRKSLSAWVPHPDRAMINSPQLKGLFSKLELRLLPSTFKWASYKAVSINNKG